MSIRHVWPQGAPCASCGKPLDLDQQLQLFVDGRIVWPLCKDDHDAILEWESQSPEVDATTGGVIVFVLLATVAAGLLAVAFLAAWVTS